MRQTAGFIVLAGLIAAALGGAISAASGSAAQSSAVKPTKITVNASEFKFVLSKNSVAPGSTVIFTVVNKGKIAHDFKIAGKKTKLLQKGQKTTLKVVFPKKKRLYPFLCTVPGHAKLGQKGQFGIGVVPKPTPTPTPTPTVSGEAAWAKGGCGACHTLAAAGSTGTAGPNLDKLKPSLAKIIEVVTYGGEQSMPALSGKLTKAEIQAVAEYVVKSTS